MRKYISRSAMLVDASLESDDICIEADVKLTKVFIKAKKIKIKSNATLTECKLFSEGEITIGRDTVIKERAILNAFLGISIGDRTVIDRDVFVGGMQSEKSELEVGDDCVILYRSYLNTTRKISIGNNTGIGGYTKIFTHSSWPNVLNGNPYKFADVRIKDNVWIAWDIIIMPGIVIDKETTVGSGAVVTKSLPASVVAVGVPAKIIGNKKSSMTAGGKNKVMLEILSDFHNYAAHFLRLRNTVRKKSSFYIISFDRVDLLFSPKLDSIVGHNQKGNVIISFEVPSKIKEVNQWIELDTLSANITADPAKHFVSFIRRYGIRIRPI